MCEKRVRMDSGDTRAAIAEAEFNSPVYDRTIRGIRALAMGVARCYQPCGSGGVVMSEWAILAAMSKWFVRALMMSIVWELLACMLGPARDKAAVGVVCPAIGLLIGLETRRARFNTGGDVRS